MEKTWESRAAMYELLARSFLFIEREVVDALVSGEYSETLIELLEINGLSNGSDAVKTVSLDCYLGVDSEEVFRAMRKEYTRLFIGTQNPRIFPFAGAWDAVKRGKKPLLFVGRESMAIERFMRRCGIVQAKGTNEPLDHIGSLLEFLQHLCLLRAGILRKPEGFEIPDAAYEDFYENHFIVFAREFASKIIEEGKEEFYIVAAQTLSVLPDKPL